jgi:hypothetical protein
MKTAILCAFLGAALFLVTGNAIAANAVHGNPSLITTSAVQENNRNIIGIADEKKQPGKNKKKANRCKRLRAECQYVSNPAKAEKVCTPQRVTWMNKNCLGKDKK